MNNYYDLCVMEDVCHIYWLCRSQVPRHLPFGRIPATSVAQPESTMSHTPAVYAHVSSHQYRQNEKMAFPQNKCPYT